MQENCIHLIKILTALVAISLIGLSTHGLEFGKFQVVLWGHCCLLSYHVKCKKAEPKKLIRIKALKVQYLWSPVSGWLLGQKLKEFVEFQLPLTGEVLEIEEGNVPSSGSVLQQFLVYFWLMLGNVRPQEGFIDVMSSLHVVKVVKYWVTSLKPSNGKQSQILSELLPL